MARLQKVNEQHTITIPKKIVELKNYSKGKEFNIQETSDGLLLKEEIYEDDLVLEEDKTFEESIEVKGSIRGKDGENFNLTVKGNIDALMQIILMQRIFMQRIFMQRILMHMILMHGILMQIIFMQRILMHGILMH